MEYQLKITLCCNECRAQFDEMEASDGEYCPECGSSSLFERVSYEEPEDCVDRVFLPVTYAACFIDKMFGAK